MVQPSCYPNDNRQNSISLTVWLRCIQPINHAFFVVAVIRPLCRFVIAKFVLGDSRQSEPTAQCRPRQPEKSFSSRPLSRSSHPHLNHASCNKATHKSRHFFPFISSPVLCPLDHTVRPIPPKKNALQEMRTTAIAIKVVLLGSNQ